MVSRSPIGSCEARSCRTGRRFSDYPALPNKNPDSHAVLHGRPAECSLCVQRGGSIIVRIYIFSIHFLSLLVESVLRLSTLWIPPPQLRPYFVQSIWGALEVVSNGSSDKLLELINPLFGPVRDEAPYEHRELLQEGAMCSGVHTPCGTPLRCDGMSAGNVRLSTRHTVAIPYPSEATSASRWSFACGRIRTAGR